MEVTAKGLFEEHEIVDINEREEITVESFPSMANTTEGDNMQQGESCVLERQIVDLEKDDAENTDPLASSGNPLPAEYYITRLYLFLFQL